MLEPDRSGSRHRFTPASPTDQQHRHVFRQRELGEQAVELKRSQSSGYASSPARRATWLRHPGQTARSSRLGWSSRPSRWRKALPTPEGRPRPAFTLLQRQVDSTQDLDPALVVAVAFADPTDAHRQTAGTATGSFIAGPPRHRPAPLPGGEARPRPPPRERHPRPPPRPRVLRGTARGRR